MSSLARIVKQAPIIHDGVALPLLEGLAHEILILAQGNRRSVASLNVGGWKSGSEVFAEPAGAAFCELVRDRYVDRQTIVGWAMVNQAGSEHPRHQHRIARVCGLYYVKSGSPPVPTIFEVDTPDGNRRELAVNPVPGRLVLFSGEAWHRVPRYDGTAPRITIAFDVMH